ncbi:MAG: hypothetical protein JOZ87_08770 [Chloroflexi bacterium]|nr:hypothetical protein [Chloroflexota bacterium]
MHGVPQQGDRLMGTLMTDVGSYMKTEDLQQSDLNAALGAAVRYDWVSERSYAANYNSRRALQNQQASTVVGDVTNSSLSCATIRTCTGTTKIRTFPRAYVQVRHCC